MTLQRTLVGLALLATIVPDRPEAARAAEADRTIDPALYQALRFRFLGPYRGGRSSAVAGVAGEPFTFYMGSAGGLFRTTNAGESWENLSDDFFEVSSVGAVALAAWQSGGRQGLLEWTRQQAADAVAVEKR